MDQPRTQDTDAPNTGRAARSVVSWIIAIAVAGFLLFAVFAKLKYPKPSDQQEPIPGQYQAILEAAVALALLVFRNRWQMWALVGAMFAFFSGVTLERFLHGDASCGCFGKLSLPPPVTLTADIAIVVASAWLMRAWRARPWALATLLSVVPIVIVGGTIYSREARPPSADSADFEALFAENDPAEASREPVEPSDAREPTASRDPAAAGALAGVATGQMRARDALLRLPRAIDRGAFPDQPAPEWLDDLRAASDPASELPALIYVYNRNCHVCQEHLPEWQDLQQIAGEDAQSDQQAMRVVLIEWEDLTAFSIPTWAWGGDTPITLLVQQGAIVRDWRGEAQPGVLDLYFATQDAGLDAALE